MVWGKEGSTTLESAGDDMDITSKTAKTFNEIFDHWFSVTDTTTADLTLDDTGGNDYAESYSTNGGTRATLEDQSEQQVGLGGIPAGNSNFDMGVCIDISGKEKLGINHNITNGGDGSDNAPSRRLTFWKKDITTDTGQFTRIDYNNSDSGSFNTGSNLSVIGTD